MKRLFYFLLLMLNFLISNQCFSLNNGKIHGSVLDTITGETIIGASISVDSLQIGSTSDMQGKYTISDMKPGYYSLKCNAVGYISMFVQDVAVDNNGFSYVTFLLKPIELTKDLKMALKNIGKEKLETIDPGMTIGVDISIDPKMIISADPSVDPEIIIPIQKKYPLLINPLKLKTASQDSTSGGK